MKKIIEQLFPLDRWLVSDDNYQILKILQKQIKIKVIKIPTRGKFFTWIPPKKWKVKHATLTDLKTGKIVIDYKNNPLHLFIHSISFEGKISFAQLDKHLRYHQKLDDAIPYVFKYYSKEWGFCLTKKQYKKLNKKSDYFVSIETEFSDGFLEIGEVTIKGKSTNEIILIAHYDHPFQANDNLSGVAVALDIAKKLQKISLQNTIKILFLPETIGSIAYVYKRKKTVKKIRAVLALDVVGNNNRILLQRSFDPNHYVNDVAAWAIKKTGKPFQLAQFREENGSDEMIFSDPRFNIPAMMLSTWPYTEYHTNLDTPDIIDEKMLENISQICLDWVFLLDKNFVPIRTWTGPLMRGPLGWFLGDMKKDRHLEVFGYKIDGEKSVLEIAKEIDMDYELALSYAHFLLQKELVKRKEKMTKSFADR